MYKRTLALLIVSTVVAGSACAKKQRAPVLEEAFTAEQPPQASHNVTVRNSAAQSDEGAVVVPIYFDFDSAELSERSREELNRLTTTLAADPSLELTIQGHTDERGSTEYNLALGERRARAARDFLGRMGVNTKRVNLISYGEERPAATGGGEPAFAQNRRDEFVLTD